MDSENMVAVFTELLEQQKNITHSQKDLMETLREVKIQMDTIENRIKNRGLDAIQMDIKPIQQLLEKSTADIKLSMQMHWPTQQANSWRIFLESDAKKWAVYLIIAITFLTYLYRFSIH